MKRGIAKSAMREPIKRRDNILDSTKILSQFLDFATTLILATLGISNLRSHMPFEICNLRFEIPKGKA